MSKLKVMKKNMRQKRHKDLSIVEIIFSISRRGQPLLHIGGSSFYRETKKRVNIDGGTKDFWVCARKGSHIHADQSTHQDESNEPKLDAVASVNYWIPMVTFQLHHQTLPGCYISRTKRGKPQLIINQFKYNLKKTSNLKSYWSCNQAPKGCRVSIMTFGDEIIRVTNEHHHHILRSISEGKSSGDDGRVPFQENLGLRHQVLVALYQTVLYRLRRQHQSRPEPHTKI
ncbi:hypothetical protein MSG28_008199 [Choristoneura fumiferana]|uniref:Uncharacterized protein n=1 Tax=Choristoneura fumiferana TaxID=7141 RepID=A0ACC0JAP0_CHOFU|nr:hypothetical protein MSG28_008199 [Choristoneura fumiferana]